MFPHSILWRNDETFEQRKDFDKIILTDRNLYMQCSTSLADSTMVVSWDLSPHSARNVNTKDLTIIGGRQDKK